MAEDYYAAKRRLLYYEQLVLRRVGFRLDLPQPHKVALNLCHAADMSPAVAQMAVAVVNDFLTLTTLGRGQIYVSQLGAAAVVVAHHTLFGVGGGVDDLQPHPTPHLHPDLKPHPRPTLTPHPNPNGVDAFVAGSGACQRTVMLVEEIFGSLARTAGSEP